MFWIDAKERKPIALEADFMGKVWIAGNTSTGHPIAKLRYWREIEYHPQYSHHWARTMIDPYEDAEGDENAT